MGRDTAPVLGMRIFEWRTLSESPTMRPGLHPIHLSGSRVFGQIAATKPTRAGLFNQPLQRISDGSFQLAR